MTASASPSADSCSPARWRARLVLVFGLAVILPSVAALLYAFPPGAGSYYPPCLFHTLTTLHCPGCGGTRCVSALVHGDLTQAIAYHPLFVFSLPLIAVVIASVAYRQWTGRGLGLRMPAWSIHLLFWVIVAFWVLRNLPVYPLTLLAPHTLQ